MSEMRQELRRDCDMMMNQIQDGHAHIVRATNISLGGMRLCKLLDPLRSPSDRLRLEFALPGDDEPIRVSARRVYADEHHTGVRFIHISHQHFQQLRGWLEGAA